MVTGSPPLCVTYTRKLLVDEAPNKGLSQIQVDSRTSRIAAPEAGSSPVTG